MSVACYEVEADPTFYGKFETAEGQREAIARSMGYRVRREPMPRRSYTEYISRIYTPAKNEPFEPDTPEPEPPPAQTPPPAKKSSTRSYRTKIERHLSPQAEDFTEQDVVELLARVDHNSEKLLTVALVRGVIGFENDFARFLMRAEWIRRIYDRSVEAKRAQAEKARKRVKTDQPELELL